MADSKLKVAHIVPAMVRGGVETAIVKTFNSLNEDLIYDVYFVKFKGELNVSQKHISLLFFNLIFKKQKYDIIVTSLWWAHLAGPLIAIFGIKWVSFIHSTGTASFMDKFIHSFVIKNCSNLIFDSYSTKSHFTSNNVKTKEFVVPYVFKEIDSYRSINLKPSYSFCWVGRNSSEKRLDLLVNLIKIFEYENFDYKCAICIAGEKCSLFDQFDNGVEKKINIYYNIDQNEIDNIYSSSKMIICLSDYEGFSVSTAEAVMNGNFVAARQVGELKKYLNPESTIWLESISNYDLKTFAKKIINILNSDSDCLEYRFKSFEYTKKIFSGLNYEKSFKFALNSVSNGS